MTRLDELGERRAYECRLTPDRALESLDEAEAFLRERGMLTRTADCALPSFFAACHEEPYRAGAGGFAEWPSTKWPWFGELARRDGVYLVNVHRGKSLLVTHEVARLLDPICRSEIARMEAADANWARLLAHLAETGPALAEDLQAELGLKPNELKALRYPLERCGAIVRRGVVLDTPGGGHVHTSALARWDQVFAGKADGGGLADLLVAGVRAAVVAPEKELRTWFSWTWLFSPDLVDGLVAEGRLERPAPGFVTTPESA